MTNGVVSELERLDASIGRVWERLAETPMQQLSWAKAWAASFAHGCEPWVQTSGPANDPSVIAPLVRVRGFPGRLELIAGHDVGGPGGFLVADPAGIEPIVARMARSGLPFRAKALAPDAPLLEVVRRIYGRRGVVLVRPDAGPPYVDLDGSWIDPLSKFNAGRRSDFRRAQRRAEQMGAVEWQAVTPAPDQVDALLDEALEVEAAGWKGELQTALAAVPHWRAFYRAYSLEAAAQGGLHYFVLRIGGEAAAFHLGVTHAQRFWLLRIGYAERFKLGSPGTLLMLEALRWAAERELVSYELRGVAEPWTELWRTGTRPEVAVRAYPGSSRGASMLALDAGRRAAARLRR